MAYICSREHKMHGHIFVVSPEGLREGLWEGLRLEGLADAALMSAAAAHPHTLPVTKATPNPTDSREEAAATAMG